MTSLRTTKQSEPSCTPAEQLDVPARLPLQRRFVDDSGTIIRLSRYGSTAFEPLVAMYQQFDSRDRTLGLPPTQAPAIREWLDSVVDDTSVLAWHGDEIVGHVLFASGADSQRYELAIFVQQGYQGSGIGTALIEAGLSQLRARDATEVWLTVDSANRRAIHVYRKLGFTVDADEGVELEMSRDVT